MPERMTGMRNEILVGNIGSVYFGADNSVAGKTFDEYATQSETNYGRAAGEIVTWLQNGEVFKEHFPNTPKAYEPLTIKLPPKPVENNGGKARDIALNGWERAMLRGMIRDVKETYPMSKNELTWLEVLNAKVQD